MKVLKFGAIWCSGCLVMKPRWEKIERENPWLQTEYFDVDENKDLVEKYELQKFPAFVFLDKTGETLQKISGEFPEKYLLDIINKYKDK